MPKNARWSKRYAIFASVLAALFLASVAWGAGRVQWKSKTLKEKNEGWSIEVTMFLPKSPDIAMVPMRFSFQPTVYYERTLVDDHDGPVLRKVPLQSRQPLVESVDVGFMDPGTGKIENRTRFSFRVTRAHGFEAGEYDVKITNTRNNQTVGTQTRIIFDGENETIDRRSMVFTGNEGKKKKKAEAEAADDESEPPKKELTPDDPAFWEGGPQGTGDDGPPPIEEKPGGCGCRVGSTDRSSLVGAVFIALGAVAVGRSRRRRRRAA
jgi:MYXO-CTERM domain-containing protein